MPSGGRIILITNPNDVQVTKAFGFLLARLYFFEAPLHSHGWTVHVVASEKAPALYIPSPCSSLAEMPVYPVFCTAKMPAQVLQELRALRCEAMEQHGGENDLHFITPTTEFDKVNNRYGPPEQDLTDIQPFSDWSVQECYAFYKAKLQNPPDQVHGHFSAFTFLILDHETLSTGRTRNSALICTDAPDISDIPKQQRAGEKIPFLKFRRSTFWAAVETLDTWEMMTGMFSDLGQKEQLSFHAESWTKHIRYTKKGRLVKFLTPRQARANQEKLLEDYLTGKRKVDMTYTEPQ